MPAHATPTADEWIDRGATYETSNGHHIFYRRQGRGPTVVMLHGFPTWSYDYASVADDLCVDHDVVTLDFLGYGASAKPRNHTYTVDGSADTVEELLKHLRVQNAVLVLHDYGGIVGQELLDRRRRSRLSFDVGAVHVLNCGVVYKMYKPTRTQRLLATPVIGPLVAKLANRRALRRGIDAVRGTKKLTDVEFDELWTGIARDNGHKLAHRHIRYNSERAIHHERWLSALQDYDGELQLIWGLADPVSGQGVLAAARVALPNAVVTTLQGVGHFPQAEAPSVVADAIRRGGKH